MKILGYSRRNYRILKKLTFFSFLFILSIISIFSITVKAENSDSSRQPYAYFTTTVTTDGRVYVKMELIFYNSDNYPVNFVANIDTTPANVINQYFEFQNGTIINLTNDATNIPPFVINLKRGESQSVSLNYQSLGSLDILKDGIYHFHDTYGISFVSPFQFKLKIEKKTDFFDTLTYSYIRKIESTPENSVTYDEGNYQVVVFDTPFYGNPSGVLVLYDYVYDHNYFQFFMTLIYLGVGGLIFKLYAWFKKQKERKKEINSTLPSPQHLLES